MALMYDEKTVKMREVSVSVTAGLAIRPQIRLVLNFLDITPEIRYEISGFLLIYMFDIIKERAWTQYEKYIPCWECQILLRWCIISIVDRVTLSLRGCNFARPCSRTCSPGKDCVQAFSAQPLQYHAKIENEISSRVMTQKKKTA